MYFDASEACRGFKRLLEQRAGESEHDAQQRINGGDGGKKVELG